MSGGSFEYNQFQIGYIADTIQQEIINNGSEDYTYSKDTIKEFKEAVVLLRKAHIYAQRVDWLLAGDDDEESFHRRLKEDLNI